MNGTDEKSKRYSRPFYARSSCLSAILLVFLACFGATTTTITIVRNEDVKGTWVADFCRIVAVVLNRPKDTCSDSSAVSNGDLTLVELQATQTKRAQPIASSTPLPTIDTFASQTLQAIQATQTAMSIRPTATPTRDTSITQTIAAIGATQTAINIFQTFTPTSDLRSLITPKSDCPLDAITFNELAPTANKGMGVFAKVGRPDGYTKSSMVYVREVLAQYPCIQYLNPSTIFDSTQNQHCSISKYHTNRIWFNSVRSDTSITVMRVGSNQAVTIGTMSSPAPDARGYLIEYDLNVGDLICVVAPQGLKMKDIVDKGGYHLWFGSDLSHYSDSWCILQENDGTKHFCS